MDDLLGEDWQSSSKQPSLQPVNAAAFASSYSSLRTTPQPSASAAPSTPNLSRTSSTTPAAQKLPTKANDDAFGGLTGFKTSRSNGTGLSIQERQRQLIEERQRQAQAQGMLWDTLGSTSKAAAKPVTESEDDILAAFNRDAKVDRSSHFPPPSLPVSEPISRKDTPSNPQPQIYGGFDDDDDTFGLGGLRKSNGYAAPRMTTTIDDDDILGDLNRPVQQRSTAPPAQDSDDDRWDENVANGRKSKPPQDAALSELTDMGFPEDTAKIALAENDGDVQRSVGWLLQQAHEESKQKAREQRGESTRPSRSPARRPQDETVPSWARQEERASSNGRSAQAASDKDASQIAQEFGSKLFKSANSLWKAGQKQVAKTVADFQQERNPSQPKWMQSEQSSRETSQRRPEQNGRASDTTNEAALLDMPRDGPPGRPSQPVSRDRSPLPPRSQGTSSRASPVPSFQDRRPASKLSRQEVEEQSAQAYISPARRKAKAKSPASAEPEVDLFSPMPSGPIPSTLQASTPQTSRSPVPPAKSASRPKGTRSIPSVSPTALATSSRHRERGTEAFKLGDYGSAHEAYSAAIAPLPPSHPLLIVILTNRSLTALKTGDAKTAVSDADRALELIGPSLGMDETIEIGSSVAPKDMREFYGKALTRKAEALEHMEKWSDAANVWRLAIEAGVGGAVSLRGRDRCEKAANPASKPAPARTTKPAAKAPPAKSLGNSVIRPALTTPSSDVAVQKLREANAAADRADDEKFQLSDKVDARLTAWKGGKADNLRALLQSMDTVLWESAGWKKVGMSDLVMPNKVKIVYMKAIAKVHPDKLPQDASVEQRMISGAVFATLNEAWDKFKKDNNL